MAAGDVIPAEHTVVRLCKPSHIENETVTAAAFRPRDQEDYLSIQWLEKLLPGEIGQMLLAMANHLRREDSPLTVRPNHGLATIPVASFSGVAIAPDQQPLTCLHQPIIDEADPHGGIHWYPGDEAARLALADFLAERYTSVVRFSQLPPADNQIAT